NKEVITNLEKLYKFYFKLAQEEKGHKRSKDDEISPYQLLFLPSSNLPSSLPGKGKYQPEFLYVNQVIELLISSMIIERFFTQAISPFIIDACNRSFFSNDTNEHSDAITEASHAAKRFYNQRNIILNRTYMLVLDLLKAEDQLDAIKKEAANKERTDLNKTDEALKEENERLKKDLKQEVLKSKDHEILKKQAEQQNAEYIRLTDRLNEYERIITNQSDEKKKSV
ncbi:4448_t:CDS:2, partial [Entrophospora sp. SA101]